MGAMGWANAEGLVTGATADTLVPQDSAVRGQAAAMLMRFCQNIGK